MSGRVLRFPLRPISSEEGVETARHVLATPRADRAARAFELRLEEPETLLGVCGLLRNQLETTPERVLKDAEFFYRFLELPRRSVGVLDEREFFLGETALVAGTACRLLSRREEARRWFDRSEAWFRHTVNSVADWSRLSYQRLALRVEAREFDEVLELVPLLIESFEKLEMREEALKCRFLEGIVVAAARWPPPGSRRSSGRSGRASRGPRPRSRKTSPRAVDHPPLQELLEDGPAGALDVHPAAPQEVGELLGSPRRAGRGSGSSGGRRPRRGRSASRRPGRPPASRRRARRPSAAPGTGGRPRG